MIKSYKREASFRQYTNEGFKDKLEQFYKFIEDFTYIDEELNPEEREQLLQSRFTNGMNFLNIFHSYNATCFLLLAIITLPPA